MTKRHLFVPFIMTTLLIAGCARFVVSPIRRALTRLESAYSMKVDWIRQFQGLTDKQIIRIDGYLMSVMNDDGTVYMQINPNRGNIDVYARASGSTTWRKKTVTFAQVDYDASIDGMKFNIPTEYIEADETDDNRYWINDSNLHDFDDFIDLAELNRVYSPTIESIEMLITNDDDFDQFVISFSTTKGDATLTLDFSRFNDTNITLPKVG